MVKFMGNVITNENEHRIAIEEVESLFGSEPGSVGYIRAHHLVDLIEAYERTVFTLPPPSADALAEYRREQVGDLVSA